MSEKKVEVENAKATAHVAADQELTENELDTVAGGQKREIQDPPLNPVPPGTMPPTLIDRPVHGPITGH